MHGRQRIKTTAEKEREQKEAEVAKIKQYVTLKSAAFQKYHANELNESGLEISAQLLSMNPELCSFWNYRRKILLDLQTRKTQEELQSFYAADLKLMEELIPRYPKSYWIWFHRIWITERMSSCDWQRELGLCTKLLAKDERNFHCWNYRRYVAMKSKVTLEKEFEFTTTKIEENFSNYSAWHQRSVLIPRIYPSNTKEYRQVLDSEYELIRNAFYTEPADQSAWIYHRWLTTQVSLSIPKEEQQAIYERELEMCHELANLLADDKSLQKWPIFTSIFILQKMGGQEKQISENLEFLAQIDSTHVHHYMDLKAAFDSKT